MNKEPENKIDRLSEKLDLQFGKIDQRFEKIDKRFDKMDHRFDNMDQRFEKMDKRFDKVEDKLDTQIINTKMGFDDLGKQVSQNTVAIKGLSDRMSHVEDDLGSFIKKWDSEQAANQLRFRRIEQKLA